MLRFSIILIILAKQNSCERLRKESKYGFIKASFARGGALSALILLVAVLCFPTLAHAVETSGKCGNNLTWSYDDDGQILRIDGSGDMWNYETGGAWSEEDGSWAYDVDPDKLPPWVHLDYRTLLLGKDVTSIGSYAFAYSSLKTFPITDEDKLAVIGEGAFSHSQLSLFYAPDSLKAIGASAFSGHYEFLDYVELNEGLESIGDRAFVDNFMLEEVAIPSTVTHMGDYAFVCRLNVPYASYAEQWAINNDIEYAVTSAPISAANISVPTTVYYTGQYVRPAVSATYEGKTLREGVDYSLSYQNNVAIGMASVTIKGKGFYTGSVTKAFEIVKNEAGLKFQVANVSKKIGDSAFVNTLEKATDATVSYASSNTQVASVDQSGRVTIHGAGFATITATAAETAAYKAGSASFALTVSAAPAPTASRAHIQRIVLGKKMFTYTGKALRPSVKVLVGGETLVAGADYSLVFKNNKNPGKATVEVTGKGAYTGTKTATFTINPKGTAIKSLKAGKKSITVKWKKQNKQVSGFQVRWSAKATMKGCKSKLVKGKGKTSYKVTKLKSGKKYYVQVRSYKTVAGKKYYSEWSKAKKVKVK